MKFLSHLICIILLQLAAQSIEAQTIKYPKEVKKIYESADQAIKLTLNPKPIIGVITSPFTEEHCKAVAEAGGNPIILPFTTDAEALRNLAAVIDGLALPQGVSLESEYSILVHKSAIDRNIPIYGYNALMAKIDTGLWRLHENIESYPALISKASLYKKAKELHKRMFTIDTHSDLPGMYKKGYSVGLRKTNQVSIQKMEEGMLDAEYLIDFQNQEPVSPESQAKAEKKGKQIIESIYADIEKYSDFCGIAKTEVEAYALKAQGKKAFFIGLENGNSLGDNLSNVEWYAKKGVTYITLAWMKDNAICHSSSSWKNGGNPSLGLTDYGKKVVREMNKVGVMIDVSHTSEQTFWDCIKLSKAPIICSHSGAKALFDHDRNITDDQIKALAKNGGVIQVYAVWNYQSNDEFEININTVVDHIDHCVKIGGIDHVGIGIDLDGGGGFNGIMAQNDMIKITMKLIERGYSENDIKKIWSGNFFRVLNEVQAKAKH